MPNFVPSSAALPLAKMHSLLSLLVFFPFWTMAEAAESAKLQKEFSVSFNFHLFTFGCKEEI